MTAAASLKRTIRPLLPDPLVARFRLRQQSRGARVNVDVAVASPAERRRWLHTAPDTYRAFPPAPGRAPYRAVATAAELAAAQPGEVIVVGHADPATAGRLAAELAARRRGAAVLGETSGPGLAAGHRAEPEVAARAIAVDAAVVMDCGPLPDGPHLLPALFDRLRAAGIAYVLVPAPPGTAPARRTDRISGPAAAVLSLVPMHDVGGGSRPAQLARALLARGFHVSFVHAYPSYESVDAGIRYLHPRLESAVAERFDPTWLAGRLDGAAPRLAVVAAPAPALANAAPALREHGFRTVYDIIDDWSAGSLGGDWYRPTTESDLAAVADAVTAATGDLVRRAAGLGRDAALIPNGVDVSVFGPDAGPLPADFPAGAGPVIGYHGSLWADWFDWEGVEEVAAADPARRVVLIGDHRDRRPVSRPNVHYLGLKPQAVLGPYVSRFDAGLLPRKVNATTHAMSPLKVYEYLAAGVPVAAPALRSLEGLAGVHVAERLAAAVEAALAASRPDPGPIHAEHSWDTRAAAFLAAAGLDPPPAGAPPARLLLRPPVHHVRRARRG